MPIETGTKLGQYEVLELIGEGAMGSVYRAYHAQLDRTGAVKVMHAISPDRDSIARFRHEAQAIARMRHPNILNVFDFGEYEGTPYMIVEFVPGGNLAGRLTNGMLPWGTVMRFLHGIAAGLDYAHSQGIVHRDVKPANVLLEKDETLVLADFGLAKLLQGSSLQSLTGVTTGTPAYMAPEQVTGHEVGPAADRYSLATIAYEMLTGSIPFEGQGVIELLYAHVHSDPARPSSLNPQLNEKVDAVILRGLAKEPGSRWATCEQFVNALSKALGAKAAVGIERTIAMAPAATAVEDRTVAIAPPPQEVDSLFAPPPSTVPPPVWGPAVAARRRRRLYEILAGAVILILLLAIGGVCAAEALQPKMSVDPTIAVPGDTVDVIASHLPADQFGQIQLHSDETFYFAFQAGGQGDFRQGIVIPSAATTGMHVVMVCWAGSCPLQTQLRIVAPGTLPNSTPSAGESPTPSGSGKPGTTPTPGRSPRPGSSPSPNPTSGSTSSPSPKASPKSSPRPTPRPSPTPTTNPCPTSTSSASLNASPNTVLLAGGPVAITGTNFTPNKSVTVAYYKAGSSTPYSTKVVTVGCNGSFSTTVNSPGGALRTDHVTATDTAGRTASANITIIL